MALPELALAPVKIQPKIQIAGLSKSFATRAGPFLALDDISLDIERGSFCTIVGPSGCGKTTLLRILAGLETAGAGSATISADDPTKPLNAMVFQGESIFPWMTVWNNAAYGLRMRGASRAHIRNTVSHYLDRTGLLRFADRYPYQLSGGMKQRVSIARAFATDPEVLLMDEPFSALDVLTAETLRTDLVDLWIEGRLPIKSVLMVTHNIEEAVLMCDRILVFSSNPGRVAAEIKVDLPHPRNRLDPTFRQLVDSIYARMTQRPEPRTPAVEGIHGTGVGMILQHVSSNVLSGLIETLAAAPYNGRADLPVLAGQLQLEADEIFHLGESLQLLRFAQLSEGDLVLTDAGLRFAHLATDARKKLFAEHLMNYVPVMGLISRVLDERPSHTAPAARFRNELEDYMAEDQADETLKTIVSWARYAELFAYDEQSELFSLENPH